MSFNFNINLLLKSKILEKVKNIYKTIYKSNLYFFKRRINSYFIKSKQFLLELICCYIIF